MRKSFSYFDEYQGYDPAIPEMILRAGDPGIEDSKDDKTQKLIQDFWKKEYKDEVITQYTELNRDIYLAQLRILLRKLHKIMQDYVELAPQDSIMDENFRLDDAKIAYFGEGAGQSTLFANTFLGRMYDPTQIKFGSKPEHKPQRLTLFKHDLEGVVFYLQQPMTQCMEFRSKHTPLTPELSVLLQKIGGAVVLLSNSLQACADGFLVLSDILKSWQDNKILSKSRLEKIFLKKHAIVYDGALSYIDWKEKKISTEAWGVHISKEAVRIAQRLKLGLTSTTEEDTYSDTLIMQQISEALADENTGVKNYFRRRFTFDAILELVVKEEIFAEIKQIIAEFQGKPLNEKVHGLTDTQLPTYEQAFRKAMQSFVDSEIFTEEELIVTDEISRPTIIQPKYDYNLFIRCMPEALKRCVASGEVVDIEKELKINDLTPGKKSSYIQGLVKSANNGWLFRLKMLLDNNFISEFSIFRVLQSVLNENYYLDGLQQKVVINLLLEAARKKFIESSESKEREYKVKDSAIDSLTKSIIPWADYPSHNLIKLIADENCSEDVFFLMLAQAECDLGVESKDLTSLVNRCESQATEAMSAWMLALKSLNLNKILAFLTRIPNLNFADTDVLVADATHFLQAHQEEKSDPLIQAKCRQIDAIKPYIDICNLIRTGKTEQIEEILSAEVKYDQEIVVRIIATQFKDQCAAICEFLATTHFCSTVDILLKLKEYAPSIDIDAPRINLMPEPDVVPPYTPLCMAIQKQNDVAMQRLIELKVDPTVPVLKENGVIYINSLVLASIAKVSEACFREVLNYIGHFLGEDAKKITRFVNRKTTWGTCFSRLAESGTVAQLDYLLSQVSDVNLTYSGSFEEYQNNALITLLQKIKTSALEEYSLVLPYFFEVTTERCSGQYQSALFAVYKLLFTIITQQCTQEQSSAFFTVLVATGTEVSCLVAMMDYLKLDESKPYLIKHQHSKTKALPQLLLHAAILAKDKFLVTELCKRGVNVNLTDEKTGSTAIMLALQLPYQLSQPMITQLLRKKCQIVAVYDKKGNSALHYAAKTPQAAIFNTILKRCQQECLEHKNEKQLIDFLRKPNEEKISVISSVISDAKTKANYSKLVLLLPMIPLIDDLCKELSLELGTKEGASEQVLIHMLIAIHQEEWNKAISYFTTYVSNIVEDAKKINLDYVVKLADSEFCDMVVKQVGEKNAEQFFLKAQFPLYTAIISNDRPLFEKLLDRDIVIESKDEKQSLTILLDAAVDADYPIFARMFLYYLEKAKKYDDRLPDIVIFKAMLNKSMLEAKQTDNPDLLINFLSQVNQQGESIISSVIKEAKSSRNFAKLNLLLPIVPIVDKSIPWIMSLANDYAEPALLKLLAAIYRQGWSVNVQHCFESYVYRLQPTDDLIIFRTRWRRLLKNSEFREMIVKQVGDKNATLFFNQAEKISNRVGPRPNVDSTLLKRSELWVAHDLALWISKLIFGVKRPEAHLISEYLFDGLPTDFFKQSKPQLLADGSFETIDLPPTFMQLYIHVSPEMVNALFREVIRRFKQALLATSTVQNEPVTFAKMLQMHGIEFKALTGDGKDHAVGYKLKMSGRDLHKLVQIYESDKMLAIVHKFIMKFRNADGKPQVSLFGKHKQLMWLRHADDLYESILHTPWYDSQQVAEFSKLLIGLKQNSQLYSGEFKEMINELEAEFKAVNRSYEEKRIVCYG